jgi:hypothetical protein
VEKDLGRPGAMFATEFDSTPAPLKPCSMRRPVTRVASSWIHSAPGPLGSPSS